MEYFQNPQGSLFKLTRGEFEFIIDLIREENPLQPESTIDTYTKDDFLEEVYMTEARYENLVAVLRNKKNIILQGAPGVGKTFAAKRLAYGMLYGAAARAAQALGYWKIIAFLPADRPDSALRAAGWARADPVDTGRKRASKTLRYERLLMTRRRWRR